MSIIEKAAKGDSEAFIELMEQEKGNLYRTSKAILKNDWDSADAVSETILICWKSISKLKNEKYFRTWLTRICINCCKQIIRKNKGLVYVDDYTGIEPSYEDKRPDEKLIPQLAKKYQIVCDMYYNAGYSIKEIAEILDMNENTVKTRLSRGREQLKKIYLEKEEALCQKWTETEKFLI